MNPIDAPAFLYRLHGVLAMRVVCSKNAMVVYAAKQLLKPIRVTLDVFQMWKIRCGPTVGCPSCCDYGSICDGCAEERRRVWG